ncbi:MAG: gliding motility-associated C-terminal domain-containing protein [Bacteroidetes bacterium]|nr:gliding motility-associated C-terminal domain-containing protein [Bacteroidota bacterium]
MMKKLLPAAILYCTAVSLVQAQGTNLTWQQYDAMKAAGTLPSEFHLTYPAAAPVPVHAASMAKGGGGTGGECNCWKTPDGNYTTIDNATQWNASGFGNGDDGSYGPVSLPFNFNLYGNVYNTAYININGNISFGAPISTYSSNAFPGNGNVMVAPFWADVDLRGGAAGQNVVQYKLTSNALYVNWTNVGYYNSRTDKLATFQVIISDGTNTDVGVGSNVSFCYKEMGWTTGQASCTGSPSCTYGNQTYSCSNAGNAGYGFCGVPATVGANRGNGVDYIQFGRFNHPGTDYNGPFGDASGVGWLDNKNFVFNTAVSTQNIPPIASSTSLCDTVDVCVHELVNLDVNFLSPEPGQMTSAGYTITPPLNAVITETNTSPANTVNLHLQFVPTVADTANGGIHVITYTATDDGAPPLTSTVSTVIRVFYVAAPPPVITGDSIACADQGVVITASGGFQHYQWSNGWNGETVLVGPGTYFVQASTGACVMVSNSITVTEAPVPAPVISGVLFNCGGEPATLTANQPNGQPYTSYNWSNGSHDPSISVGTGSYSVTVGNAFGCQGTSAQVNVLSANAPTAFFSGNPNGNVFPGTTVVYTDHSNGNGATITSWAWNADTLGSGNATTFAPTFHTPGIYPITLTVTTSDGCTHTYTYNQVVVPTEIVVPNVFTPNNDGKNDALVFEGAQFYPNTSLKVFNRWGNEVYSNANYKNTWKPSKDIPEGTYFFILRLETGKEYTGNVTLLR